MAITPKKSNRPGRVDEKLGGIDPSPYGAGIVEDIQSLGKEISSVWVHTMDGEWLAYSINNRQWVESPNPGTQILPPKKNGSTPYAESQTQVIALRSTASPPKYCYWHPTYGWIWFC